MNYKKYTNANREAWDEVAPIHAKHNFAQQLEDFSQTGFNCLIELEQIWLNKIGVVGKDVAQVCCNNGRELISIKNMGANRCVGFDGSKAFIAQALRINEVAGTDCEFICTDVYDIKQDFNDQFDLLVTTEGALIWMPDLNKYFEILSRLIKPGGRLFMFEEHPVIEMIEPGEADDPVIWTESYFSENAYANTDGLDYYGDEEYDAKVNYTFIHPISKTISCAINNGLSVKNFVEYPYHISNTWYNVEKQGPELPMSYVLVLQKDFA